ncbi:hypothetical protein BDV36DRAFT_247660 [Aspergillus pseudocaelatus]|uniref:Uncharacterized protein n=1 Tax=Aspergillus pseudocaelatus TaxID=1825620 RepID=A0ABQ6WWS4_9EURO|nr:hypothetical protein BDV36DRAFT_247660 [Aspergillus pseudocaelatus]
MVNFHIRVTIYTCFDTAAIYLDLENELMSYNCLSHNLTKKKRFEAPDHYNGI